MWEAKKKCALYFNLNIWNNEKSTCKILDLKLLWLLLQTLNLVFFSFLWIRFSSRVISTEHVFHCVNLGPVMNIVSVLRYFCS